MMARELVKIAKECLSRKMFQKGDRVKIKKEWQDEGDDELEWEVIEDEAGGRVRIRTVRNPFGHGAWLHPNQVVRVDMIEMV
jgi:hypothetical protein